MTGDEVDNLYITYTDLRPIEDRRALMVIVAFYVENGPVSSNEW
jgi:hypothetical protein